MRERVHRESGLLAVNKNTDKKSTKSEESDEEKSNDEAEKMDEIEEEDGSEESISKSEHREKKSSHEDVIKHWQNFAEDPKKEILVYKNVILKTIEGNKTYCVALSMLLVGFFVVTVWTREINIPIKRFEINQELLNEVKKLKTEFPSQGRRTWGSLSSVINSIHNNSPPGVILFLHSGQSDTVKCLSEKMSKFVLKFLKINEDPLKIYGSKIASELRESSELNIYKTIKKDRMVIVYDLEMIPPNIAKHFHSFCDVINPVVRGALYFFILDGNHNIGSNNPTEKATKVLKSIWSEQLQDNIYLPLITRMTQNVIEIVDEHKIAC